MDQADTLSALLTIGGAMFAAELTDKDALFLLTMATRTRPLTVFAAGSIAFTVTTAIVVTVGSVLLEFVPVFWVKLVGGSIMLAYAGWQYRRSSSDKGGSEKGLLKSGAKGWLSAFLAAVLSLMVLDLAGDATELLTVVFLAQFGDALLVFSACVAALVAATAVETALGNRLGRLLSATKIERLSVVVFLVIGSATILTTLDPL